MAILEQNEAGVSVAELSREHSVSTALALICQWHSIFGGMDALMMKHLKVRDDESALEIINNGY